MNRYSALLRTDYKNITRDSFLMLIYCLPVFLAVLFRFIVPLVAELVIPWLDLTEHNIFIMSFLAYFTPSFVGMVIGFRLLDDRDEDILNYLAVTPLSRTGYLVYRILSPMVVCVLIMYLVLFISDLAPVPVLRLLPVGIMAALEAPILALFLAAFANNKLEGMAISKLTGLIFLAPFIGYFVKSNWAFLAGILPPFWVSKAFLASFEPFSGYWLFLIAGFVIHGLYIQVMYRRFEHRIS